MLARRYYIVLDAERIDFGSVSDCCFSVGDVAYICDCDVRKRLKDSSIRQIYIEGVVEFAGASR